MADQIGALTAVGEEFIYSLDSGLYTPELMDEFRTALESAGIRDYQAEIQRQFDAWRAAN